MHPIIFEHGVNVLCEKPMSIKYEDSVANVRLAEEKGKQMDKTAIYVLIKKRLSILILWQRRYA